MNQGELCANLLSCSGVHCVWEFGSQNTAQPERYTFLRPV